MSPHRVLERPDPRVLVRLTEALSTDFDPGHYRRYRNRLRAVINEERAPIEVPTRRRSPPRRGSADSVAVLTCSERPG